MTSYEEKKAETERLKALLPAVREELMRIPGVSRVAVGARERAGEIVEEFVFRVHVDEKLPESELPPDQLVPREIAGVPTDVVVKRLPVNEIGFNDENDHTDYSPEVGGSRIGAEVAGGTGTLGCFCRRTDDDRVVLLSNWHVLIDPGGDIGDGVGQPRWRESCCCACGKIGEVLDYDEDLDCAIAELDSDIAYAPKIRRILRADGATELEGRIEGSAAPVVLDEVWKVGARTGLTRGMITDVDPGRVEISPLDPFPRMSNKGDSGSVYVSLATGMVCVLHNKGNGKEGFGIPFDEVMLQLHIDVIPTDPDSAYTVLDWIDSDRPVPISTPYADVAERLRLTPGGRELLRLVARQRDECLELVENHRRFTIAWHRSGGPAYLAALARSVRDPDFQIPRRLAGVDRAEAVRRLTSALRAVGSPELLADLDLFASSLGQVLAEADTAEQLLEKWEEARQLVG
ncbi:hypothetical protein EV646_113187 [Kribbella antiqua]|uniref:Trypsin-like peptidase n=1 Tax=Kribbella antiqua TaxID=2512217 RepID=A0A4R2IIL7_9ACTN|nr:hypothetical protein [Kribbella antiqua]TCO42565.1 hypothetical protein EV646_113187 [Kribbella antiqua]